MLPKPPLSPYFALLTRPDPLVVTELTVPLPE